MADCVRDDTACDSAHLPTQEEEEEIPCVSYCLGNNVDGSVYDIHCDDFQINCYSENKF